MPADKGFREKNAKKQLLFKQHKRRWECRKYIQTKPAGVKFLKGVTVPKKCKHSTRWHLRFLGFACPQLLIFTRLFLDAQPIFSLSIIQTTTTNPSTRFSYAKRSKK